MRQAIPLKKKRNGSWEMTAGPDVPYDKQRAEFHAQPGKNSVNNDVEQIKLIRVANDNAKTRHYVAGESKPKAAKKKAVNKD